LPALWGSFTARPSQRHALPARPPAVGVRRACGPARPPLSWLEHDLYSPDMCRTRMAVGTASGAAPRTLDRGLAATRAVTIGVTLA
jgi:hypothetical protein